MKKTAVVAFIVFVATLTGIAPSSAITCPTGTYVSLNEPTKCTPSPLTVTPTNLQTVESCPKGVLNPNTSLCDIPGGFIESYQYISTTTKKAFTCANGTQPNANNQCATPLIPNQVSSIPIIRTTTCPYADHPNLSSNRCWNSNYSSNIEPVTTLSCTEGYTKGKTLGGLDYCWKVITETFEDAVSSVVGYYCDGDLQTSEVCVVPAGFAPATSVAPAFSFTGTCPSYYTFSPSTGICNAYTFSPDAPTTGQIYKCLVTSFSLTFTSYFNYDASINAPVGVSRSCTLVTTVQNQSELGVYLCTSISNTNGITISFVSENDVSSVTTATTTTCDFIPAEDLGIDTTFDEITLSSDYCINRPTFELYLTCIGIQSV